MMDPDAMVWSATGLTGVVVAAAAWMLGSMRRRLQSVVARASTVAALALLLASCPGVVGFVIDRLNARDGFECILPGAIARWLPILAGIAGFLGGLRSLPGRPRPAASADEPIGGARG